MATSARLPRGHMPCKLIYGKCLMNFAVCMDARTEYSLARKAPHTLSLGSAGQMKLSAPIATIGPKCILGLIHDQKRLLLRSVSRFSGTDTEPRAHKRRSHMDGFALHRHRRFLDRLAVRGMRMAGVGDVLG